MMMQGDGFMVGSRCQDCGNQAKKECVYMRCRTCCKNKGFPCQTHVKSTWVPAYRRRQRHHGHHGHHLHHQLLQPHNPKRHRQADLQAPPSEVENFPTEVNSMATFHCVRVSSVDDGVDEYAYQTSVNIGGHVFKGILYDQGPDHDHQDSTTYEAGESSSAGVVLLHQPNFVNADALTGSGTSTTRSAASELPFNVNIASTAYSFPLHDASFSGMQFFPNRKS